MTVLKGLIVHLAVLGAASALAVHVWTKDEKPLQDKGEQVEVWGGKPDDIQEIGFESEQRRVRLEARKDSRGRWYVGHVDKTVETRPPRPIGDAGAATRNCCDWIFVTPGTDWAARIAASR